MTATNRTIVLRYSTIDRYRKTYRYRTVEGAAKKLRELLGTYYDVGTTYAVSGDGIAKVRLDGASFAELGFGDKAARDDFSEHGRNEYDHYS